MTCMNPVKISSVLVLKIKRMYLTISNFKSFQKQIIQSDQSQGILKKRLVKIQLSLQLIKALLSQPF